MEKYKCLCRTELRKNCIWLKICLTTDVWTDSLNVKRFLGVTSHYLLNNKHRSVTIGVCYKIIPVVKMIKSNLQLYAPSTDVGHHMKKKLLDEFTKRFKDIEEVTLAAISTILDPRFKKIYFENRIACSHAINKVSYAINNRVKTRNLIASKLQISYRVQTMKKLIFGFIMSKASCTSANGRRSLKFTSYRADHFEYKKRAYNFHNYAHSLLMYFVENYSALYGRQHMSYNVHNLVHLCDYVKLWGTLDEFSAFKYENYMQKIKSKIKSSSRPLQQLINRCIEEDKLNIKNIEKNYPILKVRNSVNANDEKIIQSVQCKGFYLSTKAADNCCSLLDGTISLTKIYLKHEQIYVTGKKYSNVKSFF
ncbi:hypothetical protein ALC57_05085 [Trachymyrmex cornetzi]|uniref:DUF659 domain-containing protein n=1 Tax=Trachymyrmex cornetzi TaxID=471704 RepID=A0A151JC45_9HYME|nr:hypothetical protein ALC57_05085 [Trachymyrmex cornetzi]